MITDPIIKEGEVTKSNIIISSIKFKEGWQNILVHVVMALSSNIDIDKKKQKTLMY